MIDDIQHFNKKIIISTYKILIKLQLLLQKRCIKVQDETFYFMELRFKLKELKL